METGNSWSVEERKLHANILDFLSVKNEILAFTRMRKTNANCILTNYNCALLPSENGGYNSSETSRLKQRHLEYLLLNQITINAEYLSGLLNIRAD